MRLTPGLQPRQLWQLTPVKAVPAKAQAKGSMYQGLMLIRYRLTATETKVMPHCAPGLQWLDFKNLQGRVNMA